MQGVTNHRRRVIVTVIGAAAIAACSAESSLPGPTETLSTSTGRDSSTTSTPRDTTISYTPRDTQPYTPPAAAAQFDLNLKVVGRLPGADTSRTEAVAGATIVVTRYTSVRGDTLRPSVAAGTVTTDANGNASLAKLVGGGYLFAVTPPAGSRYAPALTGIGAPPSSPANVTIALWQR